MDNPTLNELNARMNGANSANSATTNSLARKGNTPNKHFKLMNTKWAERVPAHVRNLVYILRNNTEIRRYTAIGILNYLSQKGEINDKGFVDFLWNKFRVTVNGLTREYPYTETFFLNCFVASFSSFSASAQHTINVFCANELEKAAGEAINAEEIDKIIALNAEHQANQVLDDDAEESDTKE